MDLHTLARMCGLEGSKTLDVLGGWTPNRVAALDDLPREEWSAILGGGEISVAVLNEFEALMRVCAAWAQRD